jgi:hypothetical protein
MASQPITAPMTFEAFLWDYADCDARKELIGGEIREPDVNGYSHRRGQKRVDDLTTMTPDLATVVLTPDNQLESPALLQGLSSPVSVIIEGI